MLRARGRKREFLPQASRGNPLVWVAVHPVTDQKCSLFCNWTLPILLSYSGFLKSSFVLLMKIWLQVPDQGDFVLPIDPGQPLLLFLVVRSREWERRWHFLLLGRETMDTSKYPTMHRTVPPLPQQRIIQAQMPVSPNWETLQHCNCAENNILFHVTVLMMGLSKCV